MTYRIEIPLTAPSLNEWRRWHWTKQRKEKDVFQYTMSVLLHEHDNVCPKPLALPVLLSAAVFRPLNRRRDSDNFGAILYKWAQDVLVMCGYLPDDSAEHVRSLSPKLYVAALPTTHLFIHQATESDDGVV